MNVGQKVTITTPRSHNVDITEGSWQL